MPDSHGALHRAKRTLPKPGYRIATPMIQATTAAITSRTTRMVQALVERDAGGAAECTASGCSACRLVRVSV